MQHLLRSGVQSNDRPAIFTSFLLELAKRNRPQAAEGAARPARPFPTSGTLPPGILLLGLMLALVVPASVAAADWTLGTKRSSQQAPRTESEQQVIDAYKRTNEAVVNISTREEVVDFFGVQEQEGSGSGVIIDTERALIITNSHVIKGARQIAVTLADGQSYDVRLVGEDPDNDLALLQLVNPPARLVAAELGDSSSLEVGQRVIAIGNPFGLNRTLTTGIISSRERTIRTESGTVIQDIIQTDAAINPGNSGGPLLDTAGRVIGINTAIISRTGQSSGIGFAIPVNSVVLVIPQLLKYGKVLRPKTGAVVVDTEAGPAVLFVQPGSPADQAGILGARRIVRRGNLVGYVTDFSRADFIVEVNGKPIHSKDEALEAISKAEPGKLIELKLRTGLGRLVRTVEVQPVMD